VSDVGGFDVGETIDGTVVIDHRFVFTNKIISETFAPESTDFSICATRIPVALSK
jgi:hypothetical protein